MSDQGKMRNHLCPCGSGRKFKHCHGRAKSSSTIHSVLLGGFLVLSIVLLIAYLKTGGSTAGKTGSHTVETTHYSTIPGLDLGGLGASEQRQLVNHLNQTPCICDCEMTVAECRHIDPKCDHSLERARAYLDALTAKVSGVSDLPIVPTH